MFGWLIRRFLVKPLCGWFDQRLPLRGVLERLLNDPVPERGGWWYTFGAAIFLLLIVQVVTGLFLMLYYVPSFTEARNSVIYIQKEVILGWLVRGIHYWNMVALVLLVGVHMTRTFTSAAYKTPRELTWFLGVLLMVLMVATAFTGGILRWDQAGYFDVVVGTTIASYTPIIGPWVAQLWLGGDSVNALTLTRTFPLHVWILPVALLLVASIHIMLVIIQGQFGSWINYEPEPPDAPPLTAEQVASHKKLEEDLLNPRSSKVNLPVRTTWFYPFHVFKEAVISLVIFVGVLVATFLFPVPIEEPIDPTTTTFAPSSMWFFLFQDQLLLLFPGAWLISVGAVVAPTVVIVLLLLYPWIDRDPALRPSKRISSLGFYYTLVFGILVLAALGASRVYNFGFINARP